MAVSDASKDNAGCLHLIVRLLQQCPTLSDGLWGVAPFQL